MNKLDEIYLESNDAKIFSDKYLSYLSSVFTEIDRNEISEFIKLILKARESGNQIIFFGNGGSAATANHFVNDIGIGTRPSLKPFRAVSLCANTAVITAIANDDGYGDVFVQQLKSIMQPNDLVVAISASGNSENIIKGIRYANDNGGISFGITAFTGGQLRKDSMYGLHVPTNDKEYGPAEDSHVVLGHLVSAFLMRAIKV